MSDLDVMTDELIKSAKSFEWPENKPEVKESWLENVKSNPNILQEEVGYLEQSIVSFFYKLDSLGRHMSCIQYDDLADSLEIIKTDIEGYEIERNDVEKAMTRIIAVLNLSNLEQMDRRSLLQIAHNHLIFAEGYHDIGNLISSVYTYTQKDVDEQKKRIIQEKGTHIMHIGMGGANMVRYGPAHDILLGAEITTKLKPFFDVVKEGKLQIDYESDSVIRFKGDIFNLYRTYFNLANNSMNRGNATKLKILAAQDDSNVIIQFLDNGIGLPNEDKIEDKIFKLRASYSGGQGIGLFLARQIIEAHNGKITAKAHNDDAVYNGALFKITLPKEQQDRAIFYQKDY